MAQGCFNHIAIGPFIPCLPWAMGGGGRAGNSGGTREPSSQKQFGFAETFCGFERLTKLNSTMFLQFLKELCFFAESISGFVTYPWNTLKILFL